MAKGQKGMVNWVIGLGVLFASVWVISRAWKKGQSKKTLKVEL